MPLSPFLRCLFVLAIAGAGECAAARVGELLVREGHAGVPCFTLAAEEEARGGAPDFHAISVSEVGTRNVLWRMVMPAQRTFPVTFRMCIPYAGRLPVLPQTSADPLHAGKVYEVAMVARPQRPAAAPREYRARFCLVNSGAMLRVGHPAPAGGKRQARCTMTGPMLKGKAGAAR